MGCGCLVALMAMASPRLAIGVVFLFTDRMGIAFQHFWIGLVGFVFLPWTTFDDVRSALDGMTVVPGSVSPDRCPGWRVPS